MELILHKEMINNIEKGDLTIKSVMIDIFIIELILNLIFEVLFLLEVIIQGPHL